MNPSKKFQKGEKADMNQAEGDHNKHGARQVVIAIVLSNRLVSIKI